MYKNNAIYIYYIILPFISSVALLENANLPLE